MLIEDDSTLSRAALPKNWSSPECLAITFSAIRANDRYLGVVLRGGKEIHRAWKRHHTSEEATQAIQRAWERVEEQMRHESTTAGDTP